MASQDKEISTLQHYLTYYKSCESPGYAVLVTGEWGCGKTYQVRKILGNNCYYVSLFGLQTTEEVHAEVLAAMFPAKNGIKQLLDFFEGVELSAGVAKFSVGNMLSGVGKAWLKQKVSKDKVLVFDDLERSGINIKDMLGVINLYVEHYGCRVVVVAHDEKLIEGFSEAKEKLFGQTLQVQSDVQEIVRVFIDNFSKEKFESTDLRFKEKSIQFLKEYQVEIIKIFEKSQCKSLRILKRVLEDLARLANTLQSMHLEHQDAMKELVRCFTVFDIEVRRGNLPEQALKKRSELIVAAYSNFSVEVDDDFIMKFREKYRKLLDLYEKSHCLMCDQLSDELLAQMLINGCYDSHKICQSLDQSHHFLMANAPSWRFIWSFVHLSEDVFSEKLKEFNEDFQMRRFVIPGEILHVFSLRLMLSTIGIIEDDKNKVVDDCKKYIDDLCSKNKLPLVNGRAVDMYPRHSWDGYDELAYNIPHECQDSFNTLYKYLGEKSNALLRQKIDGFVPYLLGLIETDVDTFHEVMVEGSGASIDTLKGQYGFDVSILSKEPLSKIFTDQAFVDMCMRSSSKNWSKIAETLYQRYDHTGDKSSKDEWMKEKDWIRNVCDQLRQKISELDTKESNLRKAQLTYWLKDAEDKLVNH